MKTSLLIIKVKRPIKRHPLELFSWGENPKESRIKVPKGGVSQRERERERRGDKGRVRETDRQRKPTHRERERERERERGNKTQVVTNGVSINVSKNMERIDQKCAKRQSEFHPFP